MISTLMIANRILVYMENAKMVSTSSRALVKLGTGERLVTKRLTQLKVK